MNFFILWLFVLSASYGNNIETTSAYSSIDDFISHINTRVTTWKAGFNFGGYLSLNDIRKRVSTLPPSKSKRDLPVVSHSDFDVTQIPKYFDARVQWPDCNSTSEIRNEGSCDSSWAFAAVEVMTDRQCIHSNGTKNFHYSANDVLTCCITCGIGCDGGFVSEVFEHWRDHGVVSGGPYHSHEGCSPYKIPDDGNYHETPMCVPECEQGYGSTYRADLHYGKKSYLIAPKEEDMMKELYVNGPIAATMDVYEDFIFYHSGVYKHYSPDLLGYITVKIIGYGEENGVKYWLCSNSWGDIFGEKGFFKILRGENECGIENYLSAGLPKFD